MLQRARSAHSAVDVLCVHPGNLSQLYGVLARERLSAVEPPLWTALWAAFLRTQGFVVQCVDAEAEGLGAADVAKLVASIAPALVLLDVAGGNPSASTMCMAGTRLVLEQCAQYAPHIPVILAGLHPSALPQRTLNEEVCTFVCQGEGFYTLPALLYALRAGDGLEHVPGLWWRTSGSVIANAPAPLWPDLDTLPMPAWDLLPMSRYRAHEWHCFGAPSRQPYAVLYTSMGCPFQCNFCCTHAFFGERGIRYRSIARILEELDWLVDRHNVRHIKIPDEMFALSEERVCALCAAIAQRGYDLNIWAYARVDTVTLPMLEAMKRAGINWLAYGFEAGNSQVQKSIRKQHERHTVMDVAYHTRTAGIHICGNYIFGLPEDTYDSMQETLEYAFAVLPEWANMYSAMAMPGSRLYAEAVQQGLPLPRHWAQYSQYSPDCLPLATAHLSSGQVLAFRDYAFNAYYTNPRYLDKVCRLFGEQTRDAILRMTAVPLPRNQTHYAIEVCHGPA